jgi:hypothetical protein
MDIKIAMTETGAHGRATVHAFPASAEYVEARKRVEYPGGAFGSIPGFLRLVSTTTAALDSLGATYIVHGNGNDEAPPILIDDGDGGLVAVGDPVQFDAVRKIRETPDTRATRKAQWEAWGRAAGFDVPSMAKGDLVASLKAQAGRWGA